VSSTLDVAVITFDVKRFEVLPRRKAALCMALILGLKIVFYDTLNKKWKRS
jgi:hypothetical protein